MLTKLVRIVKIKHKGSSITLLKQTQHDPIIDAND